MKVAWADDQCPQRGPSLTHISEQGTCAHCGIRVAFRSDNVTVADNDVVTVTATTASSVITIWVNVFGNPRPVTTDPVVAEDEERTGGCQCLVCRYPAVYTTAEDIAKRVMHAIAHREFEALTLAAMGVAPLPRDPDDPSDEGPA